MNGLHKVCLRGTPSLFKNNPQKTYEMSIQIEAIHEHMENEVTSDMEVIGITKSSRLVTREHFDRVDLEID